MSTLKVEVNCPVCKKSLMNNEVIIDELPSIEISAKINEKSGKVYLSQIYGSYEKKFVSVDDIPDTVVKCFCPRCSNPFPSQKTCTCRAPIATLNLVIGGNINFCTRNGCKHHSVEFENVDDAYMLFKHQNPSFYT